MTILHSFFQFLDRISPARPVYAHCDVPCGIYTPETARLAAKTVAKMVEKIEATPLPQSLNKGELTTYVNSLTRMIQTKEEHAQLCKKELLILWTDYFKPEHLEMFPNLHEIFWKAAKLCSHNKQTVSAETSQQLQDAVEEIAVMFWGAEGVKAKK